MPPAEACAEGTTLVRASVLLAAALSACGGGGGAPPVLTLLPAAFSGGTARGGELCLAAGDEARARVHVHAAAVVVTVRGRGRGGAVLEAALGVERLAPVRPEGDGPIEQTYLARPAPGEQWLRLGVAAGGGGEVCLTQVALTQS